MTTLTTHPATASDSPHADGDACRVIIPHMFEAGKIRFEVRAVPLNTPGNAGILDQCWLCRSEYEMTPLTMALTVSGEKQSARHICSLCAERGAWWWRARLLDHIQDFASTLVGDLPRRGDDITRIEKVAAWASGIQRSADPLCEGIALRMDEDYRIYREKYAKTAYPKADGSEAAQ